MLTPQNLAAWRSVLDRVSLNGQKTLSNGQNLHDLRDRVAFLVEHPEEPTEKIEGELDALLAQHPDLVWEAAEQIMKEIFRLIDGETARLGMIKSQRVLSDAEKAEGREYIALLQECDQILQDAKSEAGDLSPSTP